jgi:pSer/pThr/pTyr-binding forkhead associated (FHA) protein
MAVQIVLTATGGELAGQSFAFAAPCRCYLGRSRDCAVCLPPADLSTSRRHCVLEVGADEAVIRDLGSLNGTFLNGRCIGGRDVVEPPELEGGLPSSVTPGDELRIGRNVFRIMLEP